MTVRTTHHLDYVYSHAGWVPPEHAELQAQLRVLPPLQAGETVLMKDGTLFALVLDNLTDFDWQFSLADCEDILRAEPLLVECKRRTYGRGFEYVRHVYATRSVLTPEGKYAKQYLTASFGDPVWINAPRDSYFFSVHDYEQNRPDFH